MEPSRTEDAPVVGDEGGEAEAVLADAPVGDDQAPPEDVPVAGDYEAVLADAARTLDAVDEALRRLDAGTYGVCEACGEQIPDDELAASPTGRWCARHLPLDATP